MKQELATTGDVRHAYRLLLGREPDPAGWATFSRLVQDAAVTPRDLASHFLGCNEFRLLHGNAPIEVDIGGCVVLTPADDLAVGRSVQGGSYEPHVRAAFEEVLAPGNTFVDVGANIGYYTVLAAHRVGATGRVFAFEPMDKNLQLIYAALARNHQDWVRVHPFAASDVDRTVCMGTHEGSSNGEIVREWHEAGIPLYAQTRRLDELLAGVERIDLVKFDIEGHELHAWNGFQSALERHRPVILSEFHPHCLRHNAGVDPLDYARVLLRYGEVTVLHADGTRATCSGETALMRRWEIEDATLRTDGLAHLDLLVHPRH